MSRSLTRWQGWPKTYHCSGAHNHSTRPGFTQSAFYAGPTINRLNRMFQLSARTHLST